MTSASRKTKRSSRLKTIVRRAGIALVITAVVVAGLAWWGLRRAAQPPEWYAPAAHGAAVARVAEQIEYRLVEEFQKIREPEIEWTIRLYEEHLNAWLAERLPEWMAHEAGGTWPEGIGQPQLRVRADGIDVAIPFPGGGGERIAVARLRPEVRGGKLHLAAEDVGVGRLQLPGRSGAGLAGLLGPLTPALEEGAARDLWKALVKGEALPPEIDLADDRAVELRSIRLTDGALEMTCRTLPPGAVRPAVAPDAP